MSVLPGRSIRRMSYCDEVGRDSHVLDLPGPRQVRLVALAFHS